MGSVWNLTCSASSLMVIWSRIVAAFPPAPLSSSVQLLTHFALVWWCWGSELSSGGAQCARWVQKGVLRKEMDVKRLLKCLEEMQRAMSQRTAQGAPAAKWGHGRVACTLLSLRALTFPGRDAIKPAGALPKPTGGGQISSSSLLSWVTLAYFSPCLPSWDRGSGQKYSRWWARDNLGGDD